MTAGRGEVQGDGEGGDGEGGDGKASDGEGGDGEGGDREEVDRFDVQASAWLLRKMTSPITGKAPTFAVNGFGAPKKERKAKRPRADRVTTGQAVQKQSKKSKSGGTEPEMGTALMDDG
jgi:hypothetical protein